MLYCAATSGRWVRVYVFFVCANPEEIILITIVSTIVTVPYARDTATTLVVHLIKKYNI